MSVITWEHRGDAATVVPEFLAAAGAFGGRVPAMVDAAALVEAAETGRPEAVVGAWCDAVRRAEAEAEGWFDASSHGTVTVAGTAWRIDFGAGRSSVSMAPEGRRYRVIVEGPPHALDSIIARALAAGAVWNLTDDWHPSCGWCGVPMRAQARRDFAAEAKAAAGGAR